MSSTAEKIENSSVSSSLQTTSAVYLRIALDVAKRIASGSLPEGTKLYGRSVMASEYGVSPETIRRALKLLSDTGIVQVNQNSGAVVLSSSLAKQYVERFEEYDGVKALQVRLRKAVLEHSQLTKKIHDMVSDISSISVRSSAKSPFTNYEIDVSENSPCAGKSIKELSFWQETGATIIAVKRNDQLFLSPGPYFCMEAGDTLVFIGDERAVYSVQKFVSL